MNADMITDPYAAYRHRAAEPAWSFKNLLMVLGTAKEIQELLRQRGYHPPPEDTIQGWRNRNSIPGKWVPVFIQMGIDRKFIADIDGLKPKET